MLRSKHCRDEITETTKRISVSLIVPTAVPENDGQDVSRVHPDTAQYRKILRNPPNLSSLFTPLDK